MTYHAVAFLLCLLLCGCSDSSVIPVNSNEQAHYPVVTYPADNPATPSSVVLGRLLFHDVRLSRDKSVACSSCHLASHAFADTTAYSAGVQGRAGIANAPSLVYAAFEPLLLRGATVPTLEMQVLVPIQEHAEFDRNILEIVDELKQDSMYRTLSVDAYARPFSDWVLTRAIAAFERSLPKFSSRFDDAVRSRSYAAFTPTELRGYHVFNRKGNCMSCHSGLLFTNHERIAIGSPTSENDNIFHSRFSMCKVPSLRNVSITAPYLHDGSLRTLADVLKAYAVGGLPHARDDERLKQVRLTTQDLADLEAFLRTLTDK